MKRIERVEFYLNKDNVVTGVSAIGASSDDIIRLCEQLSTCCNCCDSEQTTQDSAGYRITPKNIIVIDNVPTTYQVISSRLSNFVDDIGFTLSKNVTPNPFIIDNLYEKLELQLNNLSELKKTNMLLDDYNNDEDVYTKEIDKILTLIDYFEQQDWHHNHTKREHASLTGYLQNTCRLTC